MNQVEIDAVLESRGALRYTLSGVPILVCRLKHIGSEWEAGTDMKLNFSFDAMAVEQVALGLDEEMLGTVIRTKGFLAATSARSSKLILHITEYVKGV